MLVLSRRASETVEFPALGICVEVLRCSAAGPLQIDHVQPRSAGVDEVLDDFNQVALVFDHTVVAPLHEPYALAGKQINGRQDFHDNTADSQTARRRGRSSRPRRQKDF